MPPRAHRPPSPRRTWLRLAALCVGAGLLVMAAAVAVSMRPGLDFATLTTDPAASTSGSAWAGVVSNIGVLVLWGAAAACLALGWNLRAAGDRDAWPVIGGGAVLAFMAIDDVFMLHDVAAPEVGIPDDAYVIVYLAFAAAFARWGRPFVRESAWPVLVLAVGALGGSLALDVFVGGVVSTSAVQYLAEDGLKLIGFLLLGGFFVHAAAQRAIVARHVPATVPEVWTHPVGAGDPETTSAR